MIWDTFPGRGKKNNVVGPVDYLHWRAQSTVFERIAAIAADVSNLTGVTEPQEIHGQLVTADLFPLLGAEPALGRAFTEDEARAKDRLIILSHRFWEQRFQADPAALGRTVDLDGKPYTIIGVMPRRFEFLDTQSEYWLPYFVDPQRDYKSTGRYLRAVARLKAGVTLAQAQAEMDGIAARAEKNDPAFSKGWGVRLVDLREEISGEYRRPLYVLLGAVGLVLLIACANVANLLLSRAASRGREMAIRTSLGAGPRRIARQLLAESALLAALGSGLGLLLAMWCVAMVKSKAPVDLPWMAAIAIDARVVAFTTLISLAATVIFGMAPALLGARVAPADTLKNTARAGGSTSRSRRFQNFLVMLEFALSMVLLAGSGLLIRSFANLVSVDTGFRPDHLLTARILLPGSYKAPQAVAFFREATHRIEALPGVRSASAVSFMPFGGLRPGTGFTFENRPKPEPGQEPVTEVRAIQPGYFRTMGIPLLRGRDFTDRDGSADHPVFIINQSLAAQYWPNEDPIGQRITVAMTSKPMPGEIVGIAADVKDQALDGKTAPSVFYAHPGLPIGYMTLVVRTSGDPAALGTAVQRGGAFPRPQPARGRHRDHGSDVAPLRLRAALPDAAARELCRPGAGAGGGGDLRRDLVFGGRAHRRNRYPHGPGSEPPGSTAAGSQAGRRDRAGRARAGPGRHRRIDAHDLGVPVRRGAHRPADSGNGDSDADSGSSGSARGPGPAGQPRRSAGVPAL